MADSPPVAAPSNTASNAASNTADKLRLDKWLWQARFFKSRALAGAVAGSGHLRVNGTHVAKAAQTVRPGDVLTFPQGRRIRVIRIEAIGHRRGPAPEAQALYTDLEPDMNSDLGSGAPAKPQPRPAERIPGAGRPTKKERRETDALRDITD